MNVPFWQHKDPAAAYIAALQQWVGVPPTGSWDLATHAAFYRKANSFNPDVDSATAWSSDVEQTAKFASELLSGASTDEAFSAIRPFMLALGFPVTTLGEAQTWFGNLEEDERDALMQAIGNVATRIAQAESTLPAAAAPAAVAQAAASAAQQAAANGQPQAAAAAAEVAAQAAAAAQQAAQQAVQKAAASGGALVLPSPGLSKGAKWGIGIAIGASAAALALAIYAALQKRKSLSAGAGGMEGCNCG